MSISPSLIPFRGAVVAVLALFLLLPAVANSAPRSLLDAELRVVDSNGGVLADHTQYAANLKLKSDPQANCFGPGTGGSGEKVSVPAQTALGLLGSGSGLGSIRPVSITDAFDFGVGLCGIGKAVAPSTGFWYLKKNHEASLTGGDQTSIEAGDEIVWYLVEDFNNPPPAELSIEGPVLGQVGKDIKVKVVEYADDGSRSPAEGVEVSGAEEPTNAGGTATIRNDLEDGPFPSVAIATREGAITDSAPICVGGGSVKCSGEDAAELFVGSPVKDRIRTDAIFATVRGYAGNDKINLRGSSSPALSSVACGKGKDKLILDRGTAAPVSKSCEKVIAR